MCTNVNDKFTVNSKNGNGKLTYPVGLIILDETILAGFNTKYPDVNNYEDPTNYLNTKGVYWTLSPVVYYAGNLAGIGLIVNPGIAGNGFLNTTYSVRPVVSLKSGILVIDDGTTTSPFVVK